ncbi:MAG: DUF2304 domain-containing protein [Candidatus Omnitrophica bacterium]|nr:DUF2304 domain-containing protein [Candidatus Omnitrophota bacterium]
MQTKLFVIITSLLILLTVVELIRRQKMTFKYSMFWLGASFSGLVLSLNENILVTLSELTGFSLPSNFVFFLLLVAFIFLSLLLTLYVNEQNNRTETLAQTLALLEHEIRTIQSVQDTAHQSPKNPR